MKILLRAAFAFALVAAAAPVLAASASPVGTWKTIDDKTHQPKSLVQITEQNGVLEGKVIKVLATDDGPNPVCKSCDGDRKDKPVEGMTIMWGLKQDGDEWNGGQILDPKNGKIYKVKLSLDGTGKKLDVHGYIGFSLIGRSQTWERQE
jgi:uncharacterized protein (DUF2147 family)